MHVPNNYVLRVLVLVIVTVVQVPGKYIIIEYLLIQSRAKTAENFEKSCTLDACRCLLCAFSRLAQLNPRIEASGPRPSTH